MEAPVPDVGASVAVSPTPHTELKIRNYENISSKNKIFALTWSPFLRAKLTATATSSVVAGLTMTSGLLTLARLLTDLSSS